MPHVIRFNGPWKCGERTIDLNADLPADASGTVWERAFGLPRGPAGEVIRLWFPAEFTASLNGIPVTIGEDIAGRLEIRNRLRLESIDGAKLVPVGVRLEIGD